MTEPQPQPEREPAPGSMTVSEWIDWVLEQYGLTMEQIARSSRGGGTGRGGETGRGKDTGAAALTLLANVLTDRFGPGLAAEVLTHRCEEAEISRSMVSYRCELDKQYKYGVPPKVVQWHTDRLVPMPHKINPNGNGDEDGDKG